MRLLAESWRDEATVAEAAARFARDRTVALEAVIDEAFARTLLDGYRALDRGPFWFQATRGDDHYVAPALDPFGDEGRHSHFSFRFGQYPVLNLPLNKMIGAARFTSRSDISHDMLAAERERLATMLDDPSVELGDNPLRTLARWIGSAEFAEFVRAITHIEVAENRCTAFASRFSHGNHLSLHTDGMDGDRLCAFAFNFTPFWLPHWGGNLIIFDDMASKPILTTIPGFNRLVLFQPPRPHVVTAVAAPGSHHRYGCSGWFHADRARSEAGS